MNNELDLRETQERDSLFGLDELPTIICLQRPPNKLLESCYRLCQSGAVITLCRRLQMPGDTQIMFRHAGTRGLGAGGHSTGNCLVSREGCRHMHRGLRPGGLYLEGLDAKLHEDSVTMG